MAQAKSAHRAAFWPAGMPRHLELPPAGLVGNLGNSARRDPHKTAIDFYGRAIRYAELSARVDALAGHLVHVCGVRAGDRVLLDMQNSPAFIVAYYAILRADAVVVPANPMYRTDELERIVADSGARVACVAQELWPQVAPLSERGLLTGGVVACYATDLPPQPELDVPEAIRAPAEPVCAVGFARMDETCRHAPPDTPAVRAGEDLALIAYTSGTTGRPKGCMLSHRALQAVIARLACWNRWTADAVALATAPFFHVTGMEGSMNLPIAVGATTIVLPRWDRAAAAMLIERRRVTHWTNVPTMVSDLLALPEIDRIDLSSLRHIGGGGTAMPEAVARRLHERTGLEYQEGWGLTETASAIHLNPQGRERRQCLGIPTFDVDTRVVDPDSGVELPPGEAGELVTRGPSLFSGYWNDPQASAAAFIELGGRRYFRTGDIGRVDADGFFTMADRLKRMINVAGYKVWPAEVEALLYRHPAILDACVVGIPDARRGETVKALIVLKDGAEAPAPEQIVEWSRAHMATYKAPRVVEIVDSLPRSETGKILWRVLQEQQRRLAAGEPGAPG